MSELLFMPALMAGADELRILSWHVQEGAPFSAGQLLATLESDKAVVEFTAERAGVIDAYLVAAGADAVKVGTAIARWRAES